MNYADPHRLSRYLLALILMPFTLPSVLGQIQDPAGVTTSRSEPSLQGTWHVEFPGDDGEILKTKLRIKQTGDRLAGTSVLREQIQAPLTNGLVKGHSFRFEVVRERENEKVLTVYEGSVNQDTMQGIAFSQWSGGKLERPFIAKRFSGIAGTWKWKGSFRRGQQTNRTFEIRLNLEFKDGKLSGSMPGFGGRPNPIRNPTFQNGEISFEVERGQGERRSVQYFQGKLTQDVIQGKIRTVSEDEEYTSDWEANRDD